jgi:signal transduction histidine kinase
LTAEQANIIQDLFQMTSRLSHLNRSLLLLAKIDNRQFDTMERIQLEQFVDSLLPSLDSISGQLHIYRQYSKKPLRINANRILLESMVNNLFINAVRHNTPDGTVTVSIDDNRLTISNTSAEPPLSPSLIFRRFYRPTQNKSGNGLGLAIVKAICDYHGWTIEYQYTGNQHCFVVSFR